MLLLKLVVEKISDSEVNQVFTPLSDVELIFLYIALQFGDMVGVKGCNAFVFVEGLGVVCTNGGFGEGALLSE